ncbi:MAG: hypothetical protein ACTS8Y_04950 [Arsenophonus sp. ER-EMS1-MAG3]
MLLYCQELQCSLFSGCWRMLAVGIGIVGVGCWLLVSRLLLSLVWFSNS